MGKITQGKEPTMAQSAIATAADYADAMQTARRAKNVVLLLLLLALLAQLTLFLLVRFGQVRLEPAPPGAIVATPVPADEATAPPATLPAAAPRTPDLVRYLVGFTGFAGLALSLLLIVVVLLILMIMLVGRLIGVNRVTSAFIWAAVLLILLFPWQAFLNWHQLAEVMRIPGVLFTYQELSEPRVTDHTLPWQNQVLLWSRYIVFPVIAMIILLAVQVKTSRGMKLALGEVEPEAPADTDTLPA
jgi:hypothetical protein